MTYNVGDLVKIKEHENPDALNRVSKIEEVQWPNYVVRPKYFRETLVIHEDNLELVEPFVPKEPGKRGRKPKQPKEVVIQEDTNLSEEQKEELASPVDLDGVLDAEFEQLWQIANRVDKKIGTNNGATSLYYHMIQEIKMHTDKTKVKRG